jgi:hypothetical protein
MMMIGHVLFIYLFIKAEKISVEMKEKFSILTYMDDFV